MIDHRSAAIGAVVLLGASSVASRAAVIGDPFADPIVPGAITVRLETVASGLVAPNALTHAGDGSNRQFIVDQPGRIEVIENGVHLPQPFLDVSSRLVSLGAFGPGTFDERGLLGLAFHPHFDDPASSGFGKVYTYTSEPVAGAADFTTPAPKPPAMNHQSVIAEWRVDPLDRNRVDPTTRREVMRIDQPQFNHNGGAIAFGPDDMLYVALGDGGGANDGLFNTPGNPGELGHNPAIGNAQDPSTVLGKILRIDVDGSDGVNGAYGVPADNPFVDSAGLDEIYATGLRNPFRMSFDEDGRLVVADVGQRQVEEVNIVEKGGNYGWRLQEGSFVFTVIGDQGQITDDPLVPASPIEPVLEYDHDEGISVIGGFVYRGTAIPELTGKYVFGDFSRAFGAPQGRLFYGDLDTGEIFELSVLGLPPGDIGLFVKGFGEDGAGELYVLAGEGLAPFGNSGVALRIAPVPLPAAAWMLASGLLAVGVARRRAHGRQQA